MHLLRHMPPEIGPGGVQHKDFDRYLEWAVELPKPSQRLPEIAERLGYGEMEPHPLGFRPYRLSPPAGPAGPYGEDFNNFQITGQVYPPGVEQSNGAHTHMFISRSGVAEGTVINHRYKFDWAHTPGPDEEAWAVYTSGTLLGRTIITLSDRTVAPPQITEEAYGTGGQFSIRSGTEFHSVRVLGEGAVTIFLRSATDCGDPRYLLGVKQYGFIVQPQDHPAPPDSY
ncbi:MAG TPA: hypothetical protein VK674_00270 [Candidatus Limnocylindria bacterium]|nr:hypothetical protein [Candidatus Limnocylindria bacterium]